MGEIKPFKISIPDSELELLKQKVLLTRLPTNLANARWTESAESQVTIDFLSTTLKFRKDSYSWREEEAKLNELPQSITTIPVQDFGDMRVYFVHSPSRTASSIPILYLHGWPGSINEISKAVPILNDAGFHIVAPSLPGWLSSNTPVNKSYSHVQSAECFHKLIAKLGYNKYVVQGGDWGGHIAPKLAATYPESVLGLHLNTFYLLAPGYLPASVSEDQKYTPFEERLIQNSQKWQERETAYQKIPSPKRLTLGIGLHDSPMGMLAWVADKLFTWSDCYPNIPRGYKWSPTGIITWTLVHYFSGDGPTAPFRMYQEALSNSGQGIGYLMCTDRSKCFRGGGGDGPSCWAETKCNVVWWRGHLAAQQCLFP